MKFLTAFIEDCKYYDIEGLEVKTILKNADIKNKTILDIGAGIGRLSFPLAKYAKQAIMLDNDKRFSEYFKKHKRKNAVFVCKSAEDYLKTNREFDIILLAWPTINFKFINLIIKSMHKNTLFIFLTCDSNSDYETIVDRLGIVSKNHFSKDINNKKQFIKLLPRKFMLLTKKIVHTKYNYPNEKTAFKVIKNSMDLWFNIKIKDKNTLKNIIEKHKKGKKIIFEEKVHFYVLKLKE